MSNPRLEKAYLPTELVCTVDVVTQFRSGVLGEKRFVSPTVTDQADAFLPPTGTTVVPAEFINPCVAPTDPH